MQYRCCVSFPNVRIWVRGGAGLCPDEDKPRISRSGQDAAQHLADDSNMLTPAYQPFPFWNGNRSKTTSKTGKKASMTGVTAAGRNELTRKQGGAHSSRVVRVVCTDSSCLHAGTGFLSRLARKMGGGSSKSNAVLQKGAVSTNTETENTAGPSELSAYSEKEETTDQDAVPAGEQTLTEDAVPTREQTLPASSQGSPRSHCSDSVEQKYLARPWLLDPAEGISVPPIEFSEAIVYSEEIVAPAITLGDLGGDITVPALEADPIQAIDAHQWTSGTDLLSENSSNAAEIEARAATMEPPTDLNLEAISFVTGVPGPENACSWPAPPTTIVAAEYERHPVLEASAAVGVQSCSTQADESQSSQPAARQPPPETYSPHYVPTIVIARSVARELETRAAAHEDTARARRPDPTRSAPTRPDEQTRVKTADDSSSHASLSGARDEAKTSKEAGQVIPVLEAAAPGPRPIMNESTSALAEAGASPVAADTRSVDELAGGGGGVRFDGLCVICLEREASLAVVPCGHQCVCPGDSQALKVCPICRGSIQSFLRIFKP